MNIQVKSLDNCSHNKGENIMSDINKSLDDFNKLDHIVQYSKILGDKTRCKIIFLLHKHGELCVCDIAEALNMSVQAVSSQLIKLYNQSIISRNKQGLTVYYSLYDKDFIKFLLHIL